MEVRAAFEALLFLGRINADQVANEDEDEEDIADDPADRLPNPPVVAQENNAVHNIPNPLDLSAAAAQVVIRQERIVANPPAAAGRGAGGAGGPAGRGAGGAGGPARRVVGGAGGPARRGAGGAGGPAVRGYRRGGRRNQRGRRAGGRRGAGGRGAGVIEIDSDSSSEDEEVLVHRERVNAFFDRQEAQHRARRDEIMARRRQEAIQREFVKQEEDIALEVAIMEPMQPIPYLHFDRAQFNPADHIIEEGACFLCMNNRATHALNAVGCNHIYCQDCLETWDRQTCPQCRAPFDGFYEVEENVMDAVNGLLNL